MVASLATTTHTAKLFVSRNLELSLKTTPALLFVFRRFDPNHRGIIDYHGANRHYQRERIGGLNVNIDEYQQRFAQHSLFDIQNKYTNIKSELASSYVPQLIARSNDNNAQSDTSIVETLQEMFSIFSSGKSFQGPRPLPDGTLSFLY